MCSLCSLKGCEQRRSELFAKQGRGQQFASEEERDRWISKVQFHVCVFVCLSATARYSFLLFFVSTRYEISILEYSRDVVCLFVCLRHLPPCRSSVPLELVWTLGTGFVNFSSVLRFLTVWRRYGHDHAPRVQCACTFATAHRPGFASVYIMCDIMVFVHFLSPQYTVYGNFPNILSCTNDVYLCISSRKHSHCRLPLNTRRNRLVINITCSASTVQ